MMSEPRPLPAASSGDDTVQRPNNNAGAAAAAAAAGAAAGDGAEGLTEQPTLISAARPSSALAADNTSERPVLAGYQILEVLGRGGMGVVYLARDAHLQRLVAIKMILHGPFADSDHRQRFHLEALA